MKAKFNYNEARTELEKILRELETGNIDVDVLTEKVKRACELINQCKTRLRSTDEEVKKILKDFGDEEDE